LNDVNISQVAVDGLMRDEGGPVGLLMTELAIQTATVARAVVRVRIPGANHTGRTSDARPPGYTKSRITTSVGHSATHGGVVFGGANAPGDPGLFLELPADQIADRGHKFPFLTTGLDSLWVG
jgi:hypothetical protein